MALYSDFTGDNIKPDKGDGNRGVITEATSFPTKPAFAVVNPDGTNIGTGVGSIGTQLSNSISIYYPTAYVDVYKTFTTPEGKPKISGMHYHNQSNLAVKRLAFVPSKISSLGWSWGGYTDNTQGTIAATRVGQGTRNLPKGATKIIIGINAAEHGWWQYGMYRVSFGLDTQINKTDRSWFKLGYLNSSDGTTYTGGQKWQYDSIMADTPTWTDVPSGGIEWAWNEPYKPTFGVAWVSFNLLTQKYEYGYFNGNLFDLRGLGGSTGTELTEYPNCFNTFIQIENRNSGSTLTSGFFLDELLVAIV